MRASGKKLFTVFLFAFSTSVVFRVVISAFYLAGCGRSRTFAREPHPPPISPLHASVRQPAARLRHPLRSSLPPSETISAAASDHRRHPRRPSPTNVQPLKPTTLAMKKETVKFVIEERGAVSEKCFLRTQVFKDSHAETQRAQSFRRELCLRALGRLRRIFSLRGSAPLRENNPLTNLFLTRGEQGAGQWLALPTYLRPLATRTPRV